MIEHVGTFTLGQAVPIGASAVAGAIASMNAQIPGLTAQLDGALFAQAQLVLYPPSIVADIAATTQMLASLNLALTLGVPDVQVVIAAVASGVLSLTADLAALQAQLDLLLDLQVTFAQGGISMYKYTGRTDAFGVELQNEIGGGFPLGAPSNPCVGVVVATDDPAAFAALELAFGL